MKKIFIFSTIVLFVSMFLTSQAVYDVNSPDSLSDWMMGNTKVIKWDKKNDTYEYVKIRLLTFPGMVKVSDIADKTVNNGSFSWKIPHGLIEGKYVVRVKTTNNARWGDSAAFDIVKGIGIVPKKDHVEVPGVVISKKETMVHVKPVIELVLDEPAGALKPGTKVFLLGKHFGKKKGNIIVKGNFTDGQFGLDLIKWKSKKDVEGMVPWSMKGSPNQIVEVVLITSDNVESKPWKMKFEGRESKWLVMSDVMVLKCGDDDNFPVCNKISPDGSICYNELALCGYHRNKRGAVGDDKGTDTYRIVLENGWKFEKMEIVKWLKTSENEELHGPTPAFPIGQSWWQANIRWKVTPADKVHYQIKIQVEGPIGTNYK